MDGNGQAGNWRKSRFSADQGNCTEVAATAAAVLVRDSKDPSGPVLAVSHARWGGFTARLRSGQGERMRR